MAAEEEYQRTGFEGKDLKAIDTLLRTYFDASGWEFSELIQANRNYYIKQGASPHPDQYEFFKDKDIIIDYPIDLYTKPMIPGFIISRSSSGLICSGYLDPCTNYLQPKNLSISWVFPPSL